MFSPEEIEKRIAERPFVPLRVVTHSGETYDIIHPELVLIGRQSMMIGTPSDENPTHFESVSRVALMHVTDLQDMLTSKPTNTNGPAS